MTPKVIDVSYAIKKLLICSLVKSQIPIFRVTAHHNHANKCELQCFQICWKWGLRGLTVAII